MSFTLQINVYPGDYLYAPLTLPHQIKQLGALASEVLVTYDLHRSPGDRGRSVPRGRTMRKPTRSACSRRAMHWAFAVALGAASVPLAFAAEPAVLSTADLEARVKELCAALAEAERGGHAFIALKWFRDSFLPRKTFRWNQHPESRQAVLAEAIQRGVVLTSKIANPKTPAYPTTTIRLNRAEAGIPEEAQRFHPVAVHGDSIEEAIEEERGIL